MHMSMRPRTLLALAAVLWTASSAGAIDLIARSPDAYECQGKAAAVLGKLAGKVQRCRERGGGTPCINEANATFRERLADVLEKFSDKLTPTRCLPGTCGREDTPAECTDAALDGPGDPNDGKGEQGFKCLEKTSKLLVKFARAASKCRKEDAKAVANGEPSNLDACLNLRELENVGDLVSAMDKLVDKNGTVDQCVIRGECNENDDSFRCAGFVMALAGEEAKLGAISDGSDIEGRTAQCRDTAHDVLIEVAKGSGDCREDDAKAQRGGQTFDLIGCLTDVVDRWAEKLAGVLAKASEKGVGPDRCIPDSCKPADTPGSCARTALENVAGL
jgi:hypothetical protein